MGGHSQSTPDIQTAKPGRSESSFERAVRLEAAKQSEAETDAVLAAVGVWAALPVVVVVDVVVVVVVGDGAVVVATAVVVVVVVGTVVVGFVAAVVIDPVLVGAETAVAVVAAARAVYLRAWQKATK